MFSKVHSCENVKVGDCFAGGDHSFILLDEHLKRSDPLIDNGVDIPEDDDNDTPSRDIYLLGSFTPDEQVQLSPQSDLDSPLTI